MGGSHKLQASVSSSLFLGDALTWWMPSGIVQSIAVERPVDSTCPQCSGDVESHGHWLQDSLGMTWSDPVT